MSRKNNLFNNKYNLLLNKIVFLENKKGNTCFHINQTNPSISISLNLLSIDKHYSCKSYILKVKTSLLTKIDLIYLKLHYNHVDNIVLGHNYNIKQMFYTVKTTRSLN